MNSDKPQRVGDYELHQAWEGFFSVRQISSGEIMHSRTEPMDEARRLYVEQSRLADRLREESRAGEPLVIWDVGLGAAANAMAAMDCFEATPSARPLHIVSFENDLDSLRLVVANSERFPSLRSDAANAIITSREWRSVDGALTWTLLEGDFVEQIDKAPKPSLIFYDMFSTKTSARLWGVAVFRKLFQALGDRAAELFTYTCSTANRAALLAAGFFVARGRNAGVKVETTIALTPAALHLASNPSRELLSAEWLAKWERSAAKYPADISPNERPAFQNSVRLHEQFRKSRGPERLPSIT